MKIVDWATQLEKNTFLWYSAFLKFAFETQERHYFLVAK